MFRVAFALSLVTLIGCVSGDTLRKKEAEADQYRSDLQAEQARSADLQRKLDASTSNASALQADLARTKEELEAASSSKQALEAQKADLERKSAEYEKLAGSLKGEIDAGRIELTELRGKMTVKMKDKILFSSGSAALGKEGRTALKAVADALKDVQGKTIRVEGHTDDVPTTGSAFASNWELSTARALAVVRFLQAAGVDPGRLAAAGYGEYMPIAPNDTPEGRSQNRRIEIVLAPAER
jgi:chemotaxis protein MotB